jgi:hypothetical protein
MRDILCISDGARSRRDPCWELTHVIGHAPTQRWTVGYCGAAPGWRYRWPKRSEDQGTRRTGRSGGTVQVRVRTLSSDLSQITERPQLRVDRRCPQGVGRADHRAMAVESPPGGSNSIPDAAASPRWTTQTIKVRSEGLDADRPFWHRCVPLNAHWANNGDGSRPTGHGFHQPECPLGRLAWPLAECVVSYSFKA